MRMGLAGLAISGMLLSFGAAAPSMGQLVQNGVATGEIVVPDSATTAEQFAAYEIQKYVKQMSGATVPIHKYSQRGSQNKLWIGNNPQNTSLIAQLKQKYPRNIDAFALSGPANQLSIIGASDDSTIWAAYQYLYDRGMQVLVPGPHGTYVPQLTTIPIPAYNDWEAPSTTIRSGYGFRASGTPYAPADLYTAYDSKSPAPNLMWYQVYYIHGRTNVNFGFSMKDMVETPNGVHTYGKFLPGSTYGKSNPGWFNLINGARQTSGSQSQVDFTNSAAAAQFALNVESTLQGVLAQYPGITLRQLPVFVSPNDGDAVCQCSNCAPLVDNDGSYTSCVVNFANMVAANVQSVYPGQKIMFLAYSNYSTPPDHVAPAANVCPVLTAWTAANSFGVDNSKPLLSSKNQKFFNSWKTWAVKSTAIGAYTYYGHYNWFTPFPQLTQMSSDIPAMQAYPNFYYFLSQTQLHWGTQGLQDWLYPKLLWSKTANAKALITAYCQAAYGPAASILQNYYNALQASMDGQTSVLGAGVQQIPSVLTPSVISNCNNLISQAQAMYGQMDPDTKWRTQMVCDAWTKSAEFAQAVARFNTGSGMTDRQTILDQCNDVVTWSQSAANNYEGQYAFDNSTVVSSANSITSALNVNLSALPAGNSTYADSFPYGGAIKFFGTYTGFRLGMYGYTLPKNGTGTITVPINAVAGHTVKSAKVSFSVANPSQFTGTLWAVAPNGTQYVLSTNPSAMSTLTVPAAALGGSIKITLTYKGSSSLVTALTGCNFVVTVQ